MIKILRRRRYLLKRKGIILRFAMSMAQNFFGIIGVNSWLTTQDLIVSGLTGSMPRKYTILI